MIKLKIIQSVKYQTVFKNFHKYLYIQLLKTVYHQKNLTKKVHKNRN